MSDSAREKILNAAEIRMIKFGYRKVAMDEIAADLRMSKNTIYLHFRSKVEMAESLFSRLKERINANQAVVEKESQDPLEIIYKNIFFLQKELSPWFDHFLSDIKQELPELWKDFVTYRTEKILEVEKLVKTGIRRGEFRKVNPTLAVRAFLGAIDAIINPEFLQNESVTFQQALEDVLDIWAKGMLVGKKS